MRVLSCLAILLLAACGQTGPLYMPDHPPASERHKSKPAAAPAPDAGTPAPAAPQPAAPPSSDAPTSTP